LNSAKVIAVGPGERDRDVKLIPVSLKEGETVLLPEYGGTEVKLAEKEYVIFPLKSCCSKCHPKSENSRLGNFGCILEV
jgi:co-chaperonin GroES (HSP10)